jgi:hypothetical protein
VFFGLSVLSFFAGMALPACGEALKNGMFLLCVVVASVRWIAGVPRFGCGALCQCIIFSRSLCCNLPASGSRLPLSRRMTGHVLDVVFPFAGRTKDGCGRLG